MANYNTSLRKNALGSVAYLLLLFAGAVNAAPFIQQVLGNKEHKGIVTISGTGFGNKAQAVPAVWDDASGTNILDKWNLAWPDRSPTPNYNTTYRTPVRGIELPHNNITRYIAGAHGDNSGADGGYNVMLAKTRTISSLPAHLYTSWYQRSDDNWTFCGDNNYKAFATSDNVSSPYNGNSWYAEYNRRPTSTSSTPRWSGKYDPNIWGSDAVNPMSGVWTKIEMEIKYSNQSDAYIKLWENGKLKIDWSGSSIPLSTTGYRTEGIGGYARCRYSTNWRYFADVYLDYSLARVVLANNPDLSQATIIEPQIPISWADGSITFTVNLGKFASMEAAYLFVFDPTGQRNVRGFSTCPQCPNPPTIVEVK